MKAHRIQLAIAAGMSALALFTVGCSADSGAEDTGSNSSQDAGSKQAKEADCLRSKGLKVEDGKDGQKTTVTSDLSQEAMAKAMKECGITGGGGTGGSGGGKEMSQADKDKHVRYAECMRKEGIDMPDPEFADGGVRGGTVDQGQDQKKFAAAAKTCAEKVGF
ncbi:MULTISPECIES: hypothetical protein [unclassified Streptomyces]|uniref:hypothetical protein n=1 Tax=unclassified Streptomyces TaxID=2593676 RepID=UPI00093CCF2C|nr:hypothetical protein [Streptomyces sp. TSRI0281]OKI34304.1 hypothetical protein A6A29_18700 [Streptomyces sp. TSRI0281]